MYFRSHYSTDIDMGIELLVIRGEKNIVKADKYQWLFHEKYSISIWSIYVFNIQLGPPETNFHIEYSENSGGFCLIPEL